MKALKIFLLALFLIASVSLNAQDQQRQRRTPEERAKMETDSVKVKAGLTDAQAAQYQTIALKYANMIRGFRDMPRDSIMKKRTEMMAQKNAEVKAIISEEQYSKYLKYMELWNQRGPRGGGNRPN